MKQIVSLNPHRRPEAFVLALECFSSPYRPVWFSDPFRLKSFSLLIYSSKRHRVYDDNIVATPTNEINFRENNENIFFLPRTRS